jgi:hypothetical protein
MLTLDEEKRILDAARVHLRVAPKLEEVHIARAFPAGGFRKKSDVKAPGSAEPIPLFSFAMRLRCSASMEEGIAAQKRICFSEPGCAK